MMKKEESIQKFIQNLDIILPEKEKFLDLSRITPINPKRSENFVINFERGMLLYALIAKIQPKTVLEIGTAEGYSTLCMAWAMSDYKIKGKIITVDPKSHITPTERLIKLNDNDIPKKMNLSTKEIWEKFAPQEWIEKIDVISGYSGEILKKKLPKIEFCYIDGSHVYEAVKHDFYATLKVVSEKFSILFDDYVPNRNDGVSKIIDEEVVGIFDTNFIKTNTKEQRKKLKNDGEELIMCFIESESLKKSIWELYEKKQVNKFLEKYQFTENRIKVRKKIEKKIPFLKNIRFRWWNK